MNVSQQPVSVSKDLGVGGPILEENDKKQHETMTADGQWVGNT